MRNHREAKINVKLLVILAVVVVVLGFGAFVARDIRRGILSARDLAAGQTAFDKQDWDTARRYLHEYLGRHPDDLAMLKKYARACLSCRPLKAGNVKAAIGAYRRMIQLGPDDKEPYEQLAMLYANLREFSELAYIAERRLERAPGDRKAPIWLGEALVALDKMEKARKGLLAFVRRLEEQQGEKYAEHAQACALLSAIAAKRGIKMKKERGQQPTSRASDQASTDALGWLNRGVEYDTKCVEALVYRARFYGTPLYRNSPELLAGMIALARNNMKVKDDLTRQRHQKTLNDVQLKYNLGTSESLEQGFSLLDGLFREDPDDQKKARSAMWAAARKDLELADQLGTDNPHLRLMLSSEWMLHKQFDRARAELEAVDNLDEKVTRKHFYDPKIWVVTRFIQAAELSMRSWIATDDIDLRKKLASEGADMSDDALAVLTEPGRRGRILSRATRLYVLAGRISDARRCLDEYVNALKTGVVKPGFGSGIGYLQAAVATSEDRPYRVIDVLEPEAVRDSSHAEMWQLLAEAYSRTDQTRRSVRALLRYLRINPRDPKMMLQLAKEYLKLRDWNRAFDTARMGEQLDATDIVLQLIRIEASIYRAVETRRGIDKQKLAALAKELVTMRAENPDRVDIRILQAIIAVYDKRPDDAEKELKQAIEECSEPLRAEMQLVRHYYRGKRMTDAIRVGRKACKNHPKVAEPWMTLSGLYVANKQHAEALAALQDGVEATEGRWEKRAIKIRLGLQELVKGDRERGISLLNGLAEKDKQEIRARSLLLATREVREDQARSQKLIREMRSTQGESGLLWRLHQAALWLSDKNWRAKQSDITEALKQCVDSDPDWSAPVLQMVEMHRRLGNTGMVEQICRQALSRNPSATDIADQLVNLLERQERFSDAQQILDNVEANPLVASAWDVRLALRSGDFTRAIDELKLRVANSDQDADSRVLLARLIYWQTRDAQQALKYLQEAEAITSGAMAITSARVMILKAENRGQEGLAILDGQIKQAEQDTVSDQQAKHARIFGAYAMRASYLVSIGRTEAAEKDIIKLTTIPGREARGYEVLGRFYMKAGRTDDAIDAMEKGAKAYPDDISLHRNWMVALLRRKGKGDREDAVKILVGLERKRSEDPDLMRIRAADHLWHMKDLRTRAEDLLKQKTPESNAEAKDLLEKARERRKDAKRILENVVEMEPTSIEAHLALIGIVMKDKQYETARDMAIRATGTNPDNVLLMLARARAERKLKNTQMATELARIALRMQPDSTQARDMFVDIALAAKDRTLLEEARDITTKAIESKPTDGELQLAQTRILAAMGMAETAVAKLEAYCATDEGTKNVVTLLALSELYRAGGEMTKSSQRIDQAAKLQPKSPDVIRAKLAWLATAGKFDEVTKRISAYLAEDKPDRGVILAAANMLASSESLNDKKEALKLYERLAAAAPNVLDVQLGLASTAYQTGDAERARKILRSALEKDPSNVRAMNDLAWILAEKFLRYKEALKLADKGLSLDPDNLSLLDTRGVILSNLPGRFTDAKTDFEALAKSVVAGSPRQAKALLKLGRVCVKLNEVAKAKQHFTKAAEIDRKHNVFSAEERSEIKKTIGS